MPASRRAERRPPLAEYLYHLGQVARSQAATPETSGYGALETLLSRVGGSLPNPVTAIMQLRDEGSGMPDGGLFDVRQLRAALGLPDSHTTAGGRLFAGQPPTHGVVEAKTADVELADLARTAQIRRYLKRYGKVLLTNYRQFSVLERGPGGVPTRGETFSLAESAAMFWERTRTPTTLAEEESDFADYIRRTFSSGAPIQGPSDLAWFLASYARIALARVEAGDLAALSPLRRALSDSLGLTFRTDEGERFFRSTLVQTLFYGIFSAWVIWHEDEPSRTDRFAWREASWSLDVPMVRALFDQIATPSNLAPLKLDEVLDWAGESLGRVDRAVFFEAFQADQAVQFFYEPFLAAFDPSLRKALGVWYTPPEVVRYMVARVDEALRDQLGIAEGLADERVWVLDPCTGTGSYLVEVLRTIHRKLSRRDDALVGADLKRAATSRVIGFELLPAPFVVAHLQIGLLLSRVGIPLAHGGERAQVYLTNALTGWLSDPPQTEISFPDLAAERDAAQQVKRVDPILVVLGNPPYNAFAGVSPEEDGGLLDAYKDGLSEWGVTRNSLDDLYVRFLRVATRRIAGSDAGGVVCLISNFSYLADPGHVLVRRRLLDDFDTVTIDNLNGDSRSTKKRTPEGLPDPSIFPQQIRVGTAVGLFVRQPIGSHVPAESVSYRDFWGKSKRDDLAGSVEAGVPEYKSLKPLPDLAFAFKPQRVAPGYSSWPRIDEWCELPPLLGLNENRRGTLIAPTSAELETRLRPYFDPREALDRLPENLAGLASPASAYRPANVREALLPDGFQAQHLGPFLAKPFDSVWAYLETRKRLWNRARPELVALRSAGVRFLLARRRGFGEDDAGSFIVSSAVGDQHALHKDAYYIPTRLPLALDVARSSTRQRGRRSGSSEVQASLFDQDSGLLLAGSTTDRVEAHLKANLSGRARGYLDDLGASDPDGEDSELLWLHALALGYAPSYHQDNRDAGRFGFPRIPLPATLDVLRAGAKLGGEVASCVDVSGTHTPLQADVTTFWNRIATPVPVRNIQGQLQASDLSLRGWASIQKIGIFPADGPASIRSPNAEETAGRLALAARLEVDRSSLDALLGSEVVDLRMNERAMWRCVPVRVWDMNVGGYSVLRKWLSYRDERVLGRPMSVSEARGFADVVRRLTHLRLLGPRLDEVYERTLADVYTW